MPIEFIGGTAKLSPMIKAHAILMFLAWGILVPLGLVYSFFFIFVILHITTSNRGKYKIIQQNFNLPF